MRLAIITSLLVASSTVALADPASIKLTKDQIKAAEDAAVKRLPPVDKAQVAQCQKLLDQANKGDPTAPELGGLAACYRSAGSLGAAITMWKLVLQRYPTAPEAKEAQGALGPAYEAGGFFDNAARAYDDYNKKYPKAADRDLEVRAVCTWEQLGSDHEIQNGLVFLAKRWPKVTFDPDHLCDTIRPIAVP